MNTFELKLVEKLYAKLASIEQDLEALTELCQDTGEIEYQQKYLKLIQEWRENIGSRIPFRCVCGCSEWTKQNIVKIKPPSLDHGRGIREQLDSRINYVCSRCGALLI